MKRRDVSRLVGGPQDVADSIQQRTQDETYVETNWSQLLVEYTNEWIAVRRGRVVGSERTQRRLLQSLQNKGIDANCVVVCYMDPDPREIILLAA